MPLKPLTANLLSLEVMLKTEKNENVRQQIEQSLQRLRAVQPDKQ